MPKKGRPSKQASEKSSTNNTISVTPRTRNGKRSAASNSAKREAQEEIKHTKSGRRIVKPRRNSTIQARERKSKNPWEESDEEADYHPYSADFSNSDLDSEVADEDKDYKLANGTSDTSSDEAEALIPEDVSPSEEIFCPWKEMTADRLPELVLPCSSSDLLVDKDHLFDTLEVYEIIRVYQHVLQISPFLFEDFCCAMRSPTQSRLLCEIHIAFIRLLFREDEDDQTIYSVQDTGNSFNIMLQLLENMTFAEILRQYVESDARFTGEVVDIVRNTNYPFVELEKRLVVLKWLCDRFFETAIFKKTMKADGKTNHDSHCRDCAKPGDGELLLLCDGCEASYHLGCANLDEVPSGNWLCQVCQLHQVKGVTDCVFPGQLKRISSLGFDRHGRLYWFVARRLFVQDIEHNEVYYYSSLPQFYELFSSLDGAHYEERLCRSLAKQLPLIAEQMRVTLELTDERRGNLQRKTQRDSPQPYLHVDNAHRMSKIVADTVLYGEENNSSKMETDGHNGTEGNMRKLKSLMQFEDGHLADTFWTGGQNESQLVDYHHKLENEYALMNSEGKINGLALLEDLQQRNQRGYRLAFSDGEYREYVNQYSINDYAKSPYQRAKERDRKKYMCSRFSLMDEGEFTWIPPKGKNCFGTEADVNRTIQLSLKKLTEKIPDELMHRLWKHQEKDKFMQELQQSNSVEALKMQVLQYEKLVRKPVFSSIWWNTLGHTKLIRTTAEDREKRQKLDTMKKKEERMWVKYVRFMGPPKHNIWRLKDEQFRVNGRDTLGGWIWISSTMVRKFVDLPKKPPLRITANTPLEQLKTKESRKAHRLDKLVKSWATWRAINEHTGQSNANRQTSTCYSSSCRLMACTKSDISGRPIALLASTSIAGRFLPCYSPSCSRRNSVPSTSEVRKAFKPFRRNPYDPSTHLQKRNPDFVPGEGVPFPVQRPFEYKSKSGKRSLLVLPQKTLHKFARQGGLKTVPMIPGFNRLAKSNASVWNYPCPRPLFDNCWRYLTLNATSLHTIALQFRIMYSCIRWADLEPDEDDEDPRIWAHFPDYDEVRTVIGHRENPPDGYYEQYQLRVDQYSLDDSGSATQMEDDAESYRRGGTRSSSRTKKKKSQKQKFSDRRRKSGVSERWIDGVELKLYEIKQYWQQHATDRLHHMNNHQHVQRFQAQHTPRIIRPQGHHHRPGQPGWQPQQLHHHQFVQLQRHSQGLGPSPHHLPSPHHPMHAQRGQVVHHISNGRTPFQRVQQVQDPRMVRYVGMGQQPAQSSPASQTYYKIIHRQ